MITYPCGLIIRSWGLVPEDNSATFHEGALRDVCQVGAILRDIWPARHRRQGIASRLLQEHDSHAIVIDEIVGYLAATLFMAPTWENTLVAFVVFRVFDVVKPYPAGAIDRGVQGGAGVVLDDVVSGLYANLATRALTTMLA